MNDFGQNGSFNPVCQGICPCCGQRMLLHHSACTANVPTVMSLMNSGMPMAQVGFPTLQSLALPTSVRQPNTDSLQGRMNAGLCGQPTRC